MPNLFDNTSSNSAQLKIAYIGAIKSQFNDDVKLLRLAEKVTEGWAGSQVARPLKVLRNPGIGSTTDGGSLPQISRQGTVQALISAKYNYLRFGVTGPMLAASKNDQGSFVRAFSFELKEGYKDFKKNINRQLYWNGNGQLATVAANAVASVTLSISGRESSEPALKFLQPLLLVDIYTSAGALVAQGLQIVSTSGSQSASTATITLSGPVTCSSTDLVVLSGSYNNDIQGLLVGLDGLTTTIFSVDRSLYPSFQGNVLNASGGQLTLDRMQQAYNEGLRRGGDDDAGYAGIYCDFDSLRFYQKLVSPDKRYVNTNAMDAGGAKKTNFMLEFNGVPIIQDADCPQRMFFLPQEALENLVLKEFETAGESGSDMIPQNNSDAFETRLRYFTNWFNQKPASCAVLTNYISP